MPAGAGRPAIRAVPLVAAFLPDVFCIINKELQSFRSGPDLEAVRLLLRGPLFAFGGRKDRSRRNRVRRRKKGLNRGRIQSIMQLKTQRAGGGSRFESVIPTGFR